MKKYLLTFFATFAVFCGCSDLSSSYEGEIKFHSSKDVYEIKSRGGKENVRFSSALEWHIEFSDEWLSVDPMEGGPGTAKITIDAEANETSEARQAVVYICTGGIKFPITVNQEAFVPTFDLLDTEAEISCLGGEVVVRVHTDLDYDFECDADWVTYTSTKAPRTRKLVFAVEPNTLPESRKAVITFCSGALCQAFVLTQRAGGTEADDWKYDEFVHRSLAMRFTATWCGYCPMMATAFDGAVIEMGGSLVPLNLHASESAYEFTGTTTLAKRFGAQSLPTGVIDARASIPNYQSTSTTAVVAADVARETQEYYPATTGIACKSTLTGSNLSVDVSVYAKEADDYKVTVLLLEDGIVGYQNGGSSKYNHDDVARLALSSISGDSVTIEGNGTVWSHTYTGTVKSGWNSENLEVLVYVEKSYGDKEKVKGVSGAKYGNFGDTYIDNCRVFKVGEDVAVELK